MQTMTVNGCQLNTVTQGADAAKSGVQKTATKSVLEMNIREILDKCRQELEKLDNEKEKEVEEFLESWAEDKFSQ